MIQTTLNTAVFTQMTTFVATLSGVSVFFPGQPGAPDKALDTFMNVRVLVGSSRQITMGVRNFRKRGSVEIRVSTPPGVGSAAADAIVAALEAYFSGRTYQNVVYQTVVPRSSGEIDGAFVTVVEMPFYAERSE